MTIDGIFRDISAARLAPYMALAGQDKRRALQLHTWNAALGAALFPVIQVAEISIRNLAMARIRAKKLRAECVGKWWRDEDLRRKLGTEQTRQLDNKVAETEARMPRENVQRVTDYLVRDLPFGFWVSFYSKIFQSTLWPNPLYTYLPPSPARPRDLTIDRLHAGIESIRVFRNRVAHHRNLVSKIAPSAEDSYNEMLTTLRWVAPHAATHADAISTFPLIWNACPIPHVELRAKIAQASTPPIR